MFHVANLDVSAVRAGAGIAIATQRCVGRAAKSKRKLDVAGPVDDPGQRVGMKRDLEPTRRGVD